MDAESRMGNSSIEKRPENPHVELGFSGTDIAYVTPAELRWLQQTAIPAVLAALEET